MTRSQSSPDRFPKEGKGAILSVAILLAVSLGAAVFSRHFNHRSVDISPYLTAYPITDPVHLGGQSTSKVEFADGVWRARYRLRQGFPFPHAGLGLRIDSAAAARNRDFSSFHNISIEFRHRHEGQALLRMWIQTKRQRGRETLVNPNELQFEPSRDWQTKEFDLGILRIPSWWIAQNNLASSEQKVRLQEVTAIEILTPDLLTPDDSGVMEMRRVLLHGPIVEASSLLMAVQLLWVSWGLVFLLVGLRSWRYRALQANHRADHAEEMARIKTEFLATMSHEIRTPLNGVLVPAESLLGGALDTDQREQVQTILESGNHLMGILQDALDFVKIEAGKIELEAIPLSLSRTLNAVHRIFGPKAKEKGVELIVELDAKLPAAILGDALRLRQILMNLVSNALKFTESGSVFLVASPLGSGEAARLQFEVRDTGIGMDETSRLKLFQRFAQMEKSTTRRFGGTGLGLSIAQGLVEAMGGQIEVESKVGVGSRFFFSIPLVESAVPDEDDTHFMPALVFHGIGILVVEDNRVNQRVVESVLKKLGCEVVVVGGGSEALWVLETRTFHLILMDCHMPVMDGFEASMEIRSWEDDPSEFRRAAATTPIVALTADAVVDIRARCKAARMDAVVSKPFRQDRLVQEIARWVAIRHDSAVDQDELSD